MKVVINCELESTDIDLGGVKPSIKNAKIEMEFDEDFSVNVPPTHIEKKIIEKVEEWFFDTVNYSYSIEELI